MLLSLQPAHSGTINPPFAMEQVTQVCGIRYRDAHLRDYLTHLSVPISPFGVHEGQRILFVIRGV